MLMIVFRRPQRLSDCETAKFTNTRPETKGAYLPMRIKLILTSLALAALITGAGYVISGTSAAAASSTTVNPHYKGDSAFNLAGAGPNVGRCGAFPENIELSFVGKGIDTEGGLNTAVFSACTNTTTNEVFDLKAIDTYVGSGDQVFIEADSFVQVIDPVNCTATTAHAVPFRVAGGTGGHAGATGQGRFNLYSNLTPCNGQTPPAFVSFEGMIQVP